jgi:HK97 family phage major capsid protein
MEDIKKEIQSVADQIDVKMEQLNKSVQMYGEGSEELKAELKYLGEKNTKLQERLEKLETAYSRPGVGSDGKFNFRKALADVIKSEDFRTAQNNRRPFDIFDKIKADMTRGTAYDSEVLESFYKPGVQFDPDRPNHIRQIVSTGMIDSYNLRFRKEDAYTDGTDMVAEGALKPQSDFNIGLVNRPVEKIAAHMRVSDEMLSDANFVSSYIAARMPAKILLKEDQQILYGSGVSPQLYGLATEAAAFNKANLPADATKYDVLRWAIKNINENIYQADTILLHPEDYALLEMTKNSNGNYILPTMLSGGVPTISGVRILQNTAVTKDDFFVGAFNLGSQLFEREGLSIRFFDQDQDNAVKNMITIVAEERVVYAVYAPNAFQYDNFTNALT